MAACISLKTRNGQTEEEKSLYLAQFMNQKTSAWTPDRVRQLLNEIEGIPGFWKQDPSSSYPWFISLEKDDHGYLPLHYAAAMGAEVLVVFLLEVYEKLLLSQASDPDLAMMNYRVLLNFPENSGKTPLLIAVESNNIPVTKALMEAGCDVNAAESEHGYSALHISILQGNLDMTRLLIEYGANVENGDGEGARPIHLAATLWSPPMIRLLVEEGGANVNAEDVAGENPLFYCIREYNGDEDVDGLFSSTLRALLGHGVSETWPNVEGENALDFARDACDPFVMDLLKSLMGERDRGNGAKWAHTKATAPQHSLSSSMSPADLSWSDPNLSGVGHSNALDKVKKSAVPLSNSDHPMGTPSRSEWLDGASDLSASCSSLSSSSRGIFLVS